MIKSFLQKIGLVTCLGALIWCASDLLSDDSFLCELPVPVAQPRLSDLCGAVGFGDRPTREERLAWASRPEGSCEALRSHVARFPDGAYREQAAELIATRSQTGEEIWHARERRQDRHYIELGPWFSRLADAQADVRERAAVSTQSDCRSLESDGLVREALGRIVEPELLCEQSAGRYRCALEGQFLCAFEERVIINSERCG